MVKFELKAERFPDPLVIIELRRFWNTNLSWDHNSWHHIPDIFHGNNRGLIWFLWPSYLLGYLVKRGPVWGLRPRPEQNSYQTVVEICPDTFKK